MVRKKIDNRIRVLIENGIHSAHRSMFIMVGDKGRDQVVILHHMLSKATVKARPNVLWCYKSDLGFSSHRKKKMRKFQKKIASGKVDVNEDDPFELFVASTNIRYCYYSETHKILGQTFGMCVLQDFEAITPNLLARTMETVEGGGIIIILLRTVESLKQLYTMNMDVHARFRTEAHQNVVCRFNERFILSLSSVENCMVLDDSLHVLPISSRSVGLVPILEQEEPHDVELSSLKDSLRETQPVGVLVNLCKTLDQAKAVLKFIDAISEKQLNATVTLTAARGRGKSAALGLSIAGAIAFGYSNVYVTSPSPENLKTLFDFVFKGFEVLEYRHHEDYDFIQSTNPEFNKAVVRVNFFRDHRQTIQYLDPHSAHKLGPAELLVIDEAAAIPLPLVKSLFGPYLIFMSSTISGYEGTGRSLSLKLIQQLRSQSSVTATEAKGASKVSARVLHEVSLGESIRYKPGDGVEKWLTNLLCLDATVAPMQQIRCPAPKDCDLYYINRDALFSGHAVSEQFLTQIMSLYVSSHYKNSPNDLQLLSDAPAHILMCLMGPTDPNKKVVPEVLVVLQICLEGEISKRSISTGLAQGKRASGDLIPWTVAQQFQDQDFPSMSGARIVRIATHPDYQGMGYGSRVMSLLQQYYEIKMDFVDNTVNHLESLAESIHDDELDLLTERIAPRKILPPLLCPLNEREPERLQYLGVSFGVTLDLLKFWKRANFVPVYMRQTPNDLTGEHTCIMLSVLENATHTSDPTWLGEYFRDFQRRFISLLSFQFRVYPPALAISILQNKRQSVENAADISATELNVNVTPYDIKRLELYTKNMADYHLIMDLVPILSRLYFLNKFGSVRLSAIQTAILVGMGLQHKTVDEIATPLGLAGTQLLGLFNRTIRKMLEYMNGILEKDLASQLKNYGGEKAAAMLPVAESLSHELDVAVSDLKKKQNKELSKLKKDNLSQYAIKGSDDAWSSALQTATPKLSVSVKVGEKRLADEENVDAEKKKKGEGVKGWKRSNPKHTQRPNKPKKAS